jgi:hypothetical protein
MAPLSGHMAAEVNSSLRDSTRDSLQRTTMYLVRVGELADPQPIEGVVKLQVKGAVARGSLSHVAAGRRPERP